MCNNHELNTKDNGSIKGMSCDKVKIKNIFRVLKKT